MAIHSELLGSSHWPFLLRRNRTFLSSRLLFHECNTFPYNTSADLYMLPPFLIEAVSECSIPLQTLLASEVSHQSSNSRRINRAIPKDTTWSQVSQRDKTSTQSVVIFVRRSTYSDTRKWPLNREWRWSYDWRDKKWGTRREIHTKNDLNIVK